MKIENNMEVIGKKSSGFMVWSLILGIIIMVIGIALATMGYKDTGDAEYRVFGILATLIGVGEFAYAIYILILPKNLIAVNENSIILLKQKKEILFTDIISVFPRRSGSRNKTYSSGKIIVTTANGVYEQGQVAEVEYVANILNSKLRGK